MRSTTSASYTPRLAYRPQEVAEATGLSLQTVYNLVASGRLHAVQPGGRGARVLIPAESLRKLLLDPFETAGTSPPATFASRPIEAIEFDDRSGGGDA